MGDDWSALTIPTPAAPSTPPPPVAAAATDPANAGIRREPELPEHEEIVPDDRPVAGEFDVLDDEPDVDAAKSRTMRQQVTSAARQATMDPADGIEL